MDQDQQQQQQKYAPPVHGGGYGPVILVLAVIMVLGAAAAVLGRLFTGRRICGYGGGFNFEDWLERKCAARLDGRIGNPPPQQVNVAEPSAVVEAPAAAASRTVEGGG